MILISNLILYVEDGGTIASTNIYGTDKKTYINIGSGNVFKLYWGIPELENDTVDHYNLVIKRHDTTLNVYYDIFDENIKSVNEFYVTSSLLPALPEQYMLSIYLVAYGKQGSILISNIVNPYVSKGSGTYVKVQPEGSTQPIIKRALALAKVNEPSTILLLDSKSRTLKDSMQRTFFAINPEAPSATATVSEYSLADANGVPLFDSAGIKLLADATDVLVSTNGWRVMLESYIKTDDNTWSASNIKDEILIDGGE